MQRSPYLVIGQNLVVCRLCLFSDATSTQKISQVSSKTPASLTCTWFLSVTHPNTVKAFTSSSPLHCHSHWVGTTIIRQMDQSEAFQPRPLPFSSWAHSALSKTQIRTCLLPGPPPNLEKPICPWSLLNPLNFLSISGLKMSALVSGLWMCFCLFHSELTNPAHAHSAPATLSLKHSG